MKITNKHNLPWALVRAARRDTYSKGESRKSVTQLINSPRIDVLREKHKVEREADIVDQIWALLGTAVHHILDQGAEDGHITEERLYAEVLGWTISGQVDVQYENGVPGIIDYKVTSVWSVMFDKPEWEQQLNSYAFLVGWAKDITVERLQICAILRDWRRADVDRNPDYPPRPIMMVDIPVWSREKQFAFLKDRVRLHQQAETAAAFDQELPLCSDEERWMREQKWAVYKPDRKRAHKIYDDEAAARLDAKEIGGRVEKRGGEPKRCQGDYCGVANWCSQWQKEKDNEAQ